MPCPNPKCPTHYHGRHLNKHFAEKAVCRLYVLNQKNVVHPSLDSPPDDSIVVARDGPPTETETWAPPIPGSPHVHTIHLQRSIPSEATSMEVPRILAIAGKEEKSEWPPHPALPRRTRFDTVIIGQSSKAPPPDPAAAWK